MIVIYLNLKVLALISTFGEHGKYRAFVNILPDHLERREVVLLQVVPDNKRSLHHINQYKYLYLDLPRELGNVEEELVQGEREECDACSPNDIAHTLKELLVLWVAQVAQRTRRRVHLQSLPRHHLHRQRKLVNTDLSSDL